MSTAIIYCDLLPPSKGIGYSAHCLLLGQRDSIDREVIRTRYSQQPEELELRAILSVLKELRDPEDISIRTLHEELADNINTLNVRNGLRPHLILPASTKSLDLWEEMYNQVKKHEIHAESKKHELMV